MTYVNASMQSDHPRVECSNAGMTQHWHIDYVRTVMARTGLSATALANRAGIASTTLTRAMNDPHHKFQLSLSTLQKIQAATGIPFLDPESGPSLPAVDGDVFVPVYDVAASAGHGVLVESEEVICNMAFDRRFLRRMTDARPNELAIIRVKGHSMEPTLLDDDHVLVDRTKRNLSYDGLFVIRFDDALHVKRIGRSATRGNVLVISDHSAYRDLDMPKEDLDVIGRVLWVGRKV